MFDLVAIGRAGVDLYSLDYGEPLDKAKKFAKYVGGTTANTVVGGARLGLNCALVTRVSDDELGSFVLSFLEKEGVDVTHIKKDPTGKTGIVLAEISPGREGTFIFYRENAADLHITKDDVGGLVADARALLVTGTGLSSEPSLETVLKAAKEGKSLGKLVVFNLDWRPSLWNVPKEERVARYLKMAEPAGVIIGNEREFLAATGQEHLESALESIPGVMGKLLVVTNGEKGAQVRSGTLIFKADGFKVPLLKGLGGGDGFIAGFLYGHLKGWGAKEATVFGNAVGAIVVTGHSCSESMPKLPIVIGFLKKNGYSFDENTGPAKPETP